MRIEWIERLLAWQPPGDYLKYFCNYYSPAYVAPKYPIIGVFNRFLQLAVLTYLCVMMAQEKTWAYSDTPLGTVNAFAGATIDNTGDPPLFTQPLEQVSALPYCVNESHAFKYSVQFNYDTPECRYVVPEQLVVKGKVMQLPPEMVTFICTTCACMYILCVYMWMWMCMLCMCICTHMFTCIYTCCACCCACRTDH